jgi:hypothetical protein
MKQLVPPSAFFLALGLSLGPLAKAQTGLTGTSPGSPAVTTVRVQTQAQAPDIQCNHLKPKPPVDKAIDPDPPEVPDDLEIQRQLNAWAHPPALSSAAPEPGKWWPVRAGEPLRVGFWGDSHLAAGFFTAEWARGSGLPTDQIKSRFIPANLGRAGVRLPLRKTCVDTAWRHEPGHAVAAGATSPGPGLVNLFSQQAGARLSWDLRNTAGQADKRQIRLLYQQTASPIVLTLRVDGGPDRVLDLQGTPGRAVLELVGDAPLSVVQLQLQEGALRLHGMEWPVPANTRLQMDVFGYPGATVAGWKSVAADDLRAWWGASPYDVVVLAFGTNEGNVQPFDAHAYGQLLKASVAAWRWQFPAAQCILIAPGDRGILVRRSQKGKKSGPDLLRFTRVHEEIGRLQRQTAATHGCRFWSALEAMDGAGGAYRWVRQSPPLMARDLIHFTVPGYQRLAQGFARDMGWSSAVFEP